MGGATFHLTKDTHETYDVLPQRDTNYKAYQGKKLAAFENQRVDHHESVRKKQLDMQEERRVKEIIKEKKEERREKKYNDFRKETKKDMADTFGKINTTRADYFEKNAAKKRELDKEGYQAHKDHI